VGIDYRVRTRAGKGGKPRVTAGAQAARDTAVSTASKAPAVPEFSAEESLAELRALATSAGAEIACTGVQIQRDSQR